MHNGIRDWVARHYQRPTVDQEWLADCTHWLSSELGLDPNTDFDLFIQHVEAQFLQSNLADSTVHGSGIDPLLLASNPRQKKTTGPTPLLVEIKSVTDIAHSAFNLLNTHQTRLDRADLGLAHEAENVDEDEGPVPKFPRGMLRFELSDGSTTFRAIEFTSLPELELGTTPLGYKMLLKSTPIRNGIAFLEPANVVLKGYRTEDHDVNSEHVFLSSLRKRLGRPDPPPEVPVLDQPRINPPAQPTRQHQAPPAAIDDPYVDDDDEVDPDVLREMAMQMDEAIMQGNQRAGVRAPPLATSSSTLNQNRATSSNPKAPLGLSMSIASSSAKTSPHFISHASKPVPDIGLSPRYVLPDFDVTWDDDTEPLSVQSKRVVPSEKRPLSPDPYDNVSFDMDVDESFFEQVGMIEQVALGTGTNKGKGKDTSAPGRKTLSVTKPFVVPSGAKRGTRTHGSTKRATSVSSVSGSTETPTAPSTQSSGRRLPQDPSLIVISSSEDDAPRGSQSRVTRPLDIARKHGQKRKGTDQVDKDVIDISD